MSQNWVIKPSLYFIIPENCGNTTSMKTNVKLNYSKYEQQKDKNDKGSEDNW